MFEYYLYTQILIYIKSSMARLQITKCTPSFVTASRHDGIKGGRDVKEEKVIFPLQKSFLDLQPSFRQVLGHDLGQNGVHLVSFTFEFLQTSLILVFHALLELAEIRFHPLHC